VPGFRAGVREARAGVVGDDNWYTEAVDEGVVGCGFASL
jgi:hypothetical protein